MNKPLKDHLSTKGRSIASDSIMIEKMVRKVARCNCCKIDYGVQSWLNLELVGIQRDEFGLPLLEYRNCTCGSTIARDLEGN